MFGCKQRIFLWRCKLQTSSVLRHHNIFIAVTGDQPSNPTKTCFHMQQNPRSPHRQLCRHCCCGNCSPRVQGRRGPDLAQGNEKTLPWEGCALGPSLSRARTAVYACRCRLVTTHHPPLPHHLVSYLVVILRVPPPDGHARACTTV